MYYLTSRSRYIKYFESGGKNMSFMIKDDRVLVKYHEIWNKIKNTLNTKFHSMPVYAKKYIKAKVRQFNGVVKTNFWGDEVPKEGVHHTCFCYEKNYPQVYLKENKYRVKKIKKNA